MGVGTYVVAVSGGVDSVVLLDLLRKHPGVKMVVAHFDHGIRSDSAVDRKLVQELARSHGLPFVHENGNLGPDTSEAVARKARYKFLHKVKLATGAQAIVTAHHEDDMLETAIINLLRGSGRKGLTSLQSNGQLLRPLLEYTKEHIRDYAKLHALQWREDPSNNDIRYTRNYVRHKLLPKFKDSKRAELKILLEDLTETNKELNRHINTLLHIQPAVDMLDRKWFIGLPHSVSREIVSSWLKRYGVRNINKKTIERLVVAMKTGRAGRNIDVDGTHKLYIKKYVLALRVLER